MWAHTPQGTVFVFPWPGTGTTLAVDHAGAGYPWVTLEAKAAIPLKALMRFKAATLLGFRVFFDVSCGEGHGALLASRVRL